MKTPRVSPWAWAAWALMFVVLETFAVFDGDSDTTLTQTTLHHVPAALIGGFVLWLSIHFGTRIWRNRRGKQDGL